MRNLKILALGLATAAVAIASSAAGAVTYDAVTDFGAPVFSYGGGTPGGTLSPSTFVADGCVGTSGLSCYNTPSGDYTFPAVGKNNTGSTLTFYTNVLPTNELFFQTVPGTDAILRFTAPTAGTYSFTGMFERIDSTNGAGDGVTVGILGTSFSSTKLLANSLAGAPSTYTFDFSTIVSLAAGESVDFFQNANSNVNNDGTGLQLTITAVPEAATWAMFIGGFGLIGAAMRRRTRTTVRFA
jgi:hypothetical protein